MAAKLERPLRDSKAVLCCGYSRHLGFWGRLLAAGFFVRHLAPDVPGRLVLSQTLIDYLPQQIVFRSGEELHFGHELGPHPMYG